MRPARREEITFAFRGQAAGCGRLGSPLYERLITAAADDIDAGGPMAAVVAGWSGDPHRSALALRVMGAVHRIVLEGGAPRLAAHYPSSGGSPGDDLTAAFLDVVDERVAELRAAAGEELQTNEANRGAALLAGVLTLPWTSRPFRLLEIGASAGLNLWFDRYRYDLTIGEWGPTDSGVTIESEWTGPAPRLDRAVAVSERAGCDPAPVDVSDPTQRTRLESFVWPDQPRRLARIRAALAYAAAHPPPVVAAHAEDWLPVRLAEGDTRPTVVAHSVMWQYLSDEAQASVAEALERAGSTATMEAPLARVAFEPEARGFAARVTEWPGGRSRLIARCQPHGAWIRFT